jgi:phosphohistidine phosphatase
MKTLYIIRHAKSDRDNTSYPDFERPLNNRGIKDAPEMGMRLFNAGLKPDHVISSPAKRAITTARIITSCLGITEIEQIPEMYHASDTQLLKIIRGLSDKYETAMLFGHNNGLTDFVNGLSNAGIANVPTCGIAGISFPAGSWQEIEFGKGKLFLFDFPKNKTP